MFQVVRCYPFTPQVPFSNVVFLLDMADTDGLGGLFDGGFADVSTAAHSLQHTAQSGIGPETDTGIIKFGPTSALYHQSIDRLWLNSASDLNFGSNPFTAEGWFNWSSIPTGTVEMVAKWNRNSQRSWRIDYDQSTGSLRLSLSADGSSTIVKLSYTWTPTLSTWYHIAADFDGTTYRLYIDGVMVVSAGTPVTMFASSGNLQFTVGCGSNINNTDRYFKGSIEDVRVCNVAVYASDAGFTPPTAAFPRS